MDAVEMVKRIKEKKTLDDEWFTIRDEILQFLKEDHPEEEKRMFRPLGYLEVVTMICDGLERR
jgi:hexokinase